MIMYVHDVDIFALCEKSCETHTTILMHGCYCFNVMGAGIALQIAHRYPAVYQKDCDTIKGDIQKLGTHNGTVIDLKKAYPLLICNLYTQYGFGSKGIKGRIQIENHDRVTVRKYTKHDDPTLPQIDLTALDLCLRNVLLHYGKRSNHFVMPQIGCGFGGQSWDNVGPIVERAFAEETLTVVCQTHQRY